MNYNILHEDNHLLVVNKLPGEIVQGDKTGDEPMAESLKRYLKEKYHKPGNVFLGVVHRLDRPVSGAIVFARTGKALSRMNAMLQKREVRKVYWAVSGRRSAVGCQLHESGTRNQEPETYTHLIHYLKKNESQNKSYVYDLPGPGRLKAELKYKVIGQSDRYQLLEVELLTGRHHQIRAQLAHIGMAIKGDLKYGYPRSNPDGSIHLHSRLVEFTHPVSGELISIMAPVPVERVWGVVSAGADG
ncbi:MAG: RluA family pseudouridine synthase [Bacteroidales bacterium]|nr:RluA family pseudouridine synthase [Bacteroidales bacterium]